MSAQIENLRKDIRMRDESDTRMSNAWLLVYLIPIFTIIAAVPLMFFVIFASVYPYPPSPAISLVVVFMILAILLSIISLVVSMFLTYKLIKRRNTHFKRQLFLFEDVVSIVRGVAVKKKVDAEVLLSSSERTFREAKAEETEKSAVLWAILSAVPYVGFLASWYVYYFLMKDFYKHERREDGFWEDISRALDKCGVTFSVPRRSESVPDRSFVLYLILTIITVGLFGVYWLYILLRDPNEHFKYHMQVEDPLLRTLESVAL